MTSFTNITRICIPESVHGDSPDDSGALSYLDGGTLSDLDGARYSGNLHTDLLTPCDRIAHLRGQSIVARDSDDTAAPAVHQANTSIALHTTVPNSSSDKEQDGELEFRASELSTQVDRQTKPLGLRCTHVGIRAVAVVITACFAFHVVALLVFCSSVYQTAIEPWIVAWIEPLLQPYQSREDVARFVYLLTCGVVPTVFAATLWHIFKHNAGLYTALTSARLARALRQKPSIAMPARWRLRSRPSRASNMATLGDSEQVPQLYVDATWGDIAFLLALLELATVLLIQVLVAEGISSISSTATVFRALGKAFGYMSLFTLAWLVLVLDKTSFWLAFVHLPYPRNSKLRRWLGRLTLFSAIAHCCCHATAFYLRRQFVAQLVPHFGAIYQDTPIRDANGVNALGEVALAAMIVMAVAAAIPTFRKRWHALYQSIQRVAGAVAVLAVCVHAPLALWWLLPSLVLLLTQRIVAGHHARYPVEIEDMAPLPNGVTRLVCRRRRRRNEVAATQRQHHRMFTPGQFVYLYASRISWFQWHPFYVASSPSAHRETFTMYIEPSGDWTESFFDLSKLAYATQEAPLLFIDGFYGTAPLPIYYEQHKCLVLLAEGIGITGVSAMLEELLFAATHDNSVDSDSSHAHRQVWLLWVCKDVYLFHEFEPLLLRIRAFDPTERRFRLRLFLTKTPGARELAYVPPTPCDFQVPDDDVQVKKQGAASSGCRGPTTDPTAAHHQHHTVDVQNAAVEPLPQNRTGWCLRVNARPFQAAAASPVYQVLVLLTVFGVTLALATHVEWQDHQHGSGIFGGEAIEKEGMFRPMHRVACVLVILAGSYAAYFVIACEEVVRMVANRIAASSHASRRALATTTTNRLRRRCMCATECDASSSVCATTVSTTMSATTHWVEMSPHVESRVERNSNADDASSCSSPFKSPTKVSPRSMLDLPRNEPKIRDIVERLQIALHRPDLDTFMASVAKRVSATTSGDGASVGVFASGNPKFLNVAKDVTTQASSASSDSAALRAIEFRFHCLAFR